MIGSIMKCGLPRACTSPAARVSVVGTPINLMPCEACTRPGLPTSILGLRAFCKSGGSQPTSNSAPPSIKTSAVRNWTTKLGRASTKCESSVGLARTVTATLSPPISRASEPKSGSVATTFSFAWATQGIIASAAMSNCSRHRQCRQPGPAIPATTCEKRFFIIRFVSIGVYPWLKLVGAVRAEDEFELQKNGIDLAIAEEEIRFEKVMIVLQSQFRKFCGIPG